MLVVGLLLFWSQAGDQPSAQGVPILTARELAPAKDLLAQGTNGLTWYAPSQAPGTWPDPSVGQGAAEAAIRDAAKQLSGVDYVSLSLPDFSTETAALSLQPSNFTSGQAWLEARAEGQGQRLELYGWRGQEFPQKPDRPLVHRYAQVYALYDTTQHRIIKLLATIAGEALE